MDSSTFHNIARLFARSLRELNALDRQASSRSKFFSGSVAIGAVLDDFRSLITEHGWILSLPVDDEYWDRTAAFQESADFSQMYADLTQLNACIIRASRWIQSETSHLAPKDLPAIDHPQPCTELEKRANAASLGDVVFAKAVSAEGTGPLRVIVGVADRCNYRCRTCYQSQNQDFSQFDLSSSDLQRLSEVFRYAITAAIGGFGEPLLSPAAPQILAAAKASGAITSITTNGSLLQRLANVAIDRIEVSFDGGSTKVLETIRSGASHGVIVKGLLGLSEEQRGKVAFNVVVNKLNVNEIVDIVSQARNLGIGEVCLQSFNAYLPWHDDMRLTNDDMPLLDEQVKLARAQAGPVRVRDLVVRRVSPRSTTTPAYQVLEALRELALPKTPHDDAAIVTELRLALVEVANDRAGFFPALASARKPVSQYFDLRRPVEPGTASLPYCVEAFTSIVVNSDGSTNPCCKLTWNMGNINDQSIDTIWNGLPYRTLRSSLITRREMPTECISCRDTARYANLPRLLTAMRAADGPPPRIPIPDDWSLPPTLAEQAQIKALFEPDPAASPSWINDAV